jgi:hypothetical protein
MDKLPLIQHKQTLNQIATLERSLVKSLEGVVKFLDGKTTKTEVVNQLNEIGTPDALKVAEAVKEMHTTLKAHKNTDLSEVTGLLRQMLAEVQKPQKEIKIPEAKDTVKVSNLSDIDFTTLEKAIKTIQVSPKIDVKSPDVRVDAPDLKPLQKSLTNIVDAVKGIVFPEVKIDLTKLETESKETNKKLDTANKHLETISKIRGGTSGGGSGVSFQDSEGRPVRVELTVDGKVPVEAGTTSNYESRNDTTTDTNLVYLGKATPGTATSAASWQIKRYNKSAGHMSFADDVTTFTKTWDDRTSYTY